MAELQQDLMCLADFTDQDSSSRAAQVFFQADLPQVKANKARASKFVAYLENELTPSCLAVALHVAGRCTHLHAWLFETQIL